MDGNHIMINIELNEQQVELIEETLKQILDDEEVLSQHFVTVANQILDKLNEE